MRDEIIESFTRTLFVDAYASYVERLIEDGEDNGTAPRPGAGEDWVDYAPETPEWVSGEAMKAIARIEAHTKLPVEALYVRCTIACGAKGARCVVKRHNPEQFGHYLAMQFVGHGVAWDDDHATSLDLPYGEGPFVSDASEAGLTEG